ncbi:hypothetical protein [Pseudomonas sp. M30-35]|uniref:hypothetical protein n=1 Tax=Pseudomonas sp. M30-35 TaxID=1981174 RepID=UPI000B3C0B9D|nr:hypothetical protein [Pseudomonas sp. M30-35]ARU87399.1 hypothetical protein B9K09_05145 [Pseudomonas sp. M30-35]
MNVIYRLQRGLLIFISGFTLASCGFAGDAAKEGALSLVSFGGADTFTLRGTLPANFKIKAQAYYGSEDGACSARGDANSYESTQDKTPHNYKFKIPVSYHKGLCTLTLARVALYTTGRYGEKGWQEIYDNGELRVVDKLPAKAPDFNAQGELVKVAQCRWLFQLTKAKSRLGQIDKQLDCKSLGAYVVTENLPGKVLTININESPEEVPAIGDTWIKFPQGWRPCSEKKTESGTWSWCETPPEFRTFKMGDKTCTYYPNCTE